MLGFAPPGATSIAGRRATLWTFALLARPGVQRYGDALPNYGTPLRRAAQSATPGASRPAVASVVPTLRRPGA
jgi:hypothetical protein